MSEQNITIPKKSIDFNCDLAQSFGVYKNETDLDLLDYMSSVNISCGFHSGDPLTMKKVIQYCKNKNKVIGAHIGFPDIQGFGYRNIEKITTISTAAPTSMSAKPAAEKVLSEASVATYNTAPTNAMAAAARPI